MLVVMMLLGRNHAPVLGHRAAHVLELHGGVMNMKLAAQHLVDAGQDAVAGRGRHVFDQHVTAQRVGARSQAPDVQIVHVQHAFHAAHRGAH